LFLIISFPLKNDHYNTMTYLPNSRRNFLKVLSTSTLLSTTSVPVFASTPKDEQTYESGSGKNKQKEGSLKEVKENLYDGPPSPLFNPVKIMGGNKSLSELTEPDVSGEMINTIHSAPEGQSTSWGIPFDIGPEILWLKSEDVAIQVSPFSGRWLVFLHTSDHMPLQKDSGGFFRKPFNGIGHLNDHIANYIVIYEDGSELNIPIRQRYHIGMFQQIWGENCIESVAHHKPRPVAFHHKQTSAGWGWTQTRVTAADRGDWINWLWAWENPYPDKKIKAFRFEPLNKTSVILSAISSGNVRSNPLRWETRKKALLTLPLNVEYDPLLDEHGLLSQVTIDLGQVISATPRILYPNSGWSQSYNNKVPEMSGREVIVEFAAHPDANFHLDGQKMIAVSDLISKGVWDNLKVIAPANKRVKIKVTEKGSGKPVPVKFHAHGESDEYLAPVNRHRQANDAWFEDYSVDFMNSGLHTCTYIPGETVLNVPLGKVYVEISKGFEIKPVRRVLEIEENSDEITIEIEKELKWREKGWVTADTHVHFLSTSTAMLEGSAEGVNIVNLLASQWGELMTNVGDFDGKSTYGSREAGGDGEYLVRVGTENRQHVMGHISLLGYEGSMIAPMTTGGVDESAIGDPIEILLTEWASQCKKQNGIVVLPHFPNPRLENAASIVNGTIDGVEMTSWGNLYGGIDPYSLTD
jgi:hypothetical protein